MSMLEFQNIVRAIGDENRVRAIMALRTGELCVCQIVELLQLAHSTVSKHMSILKQAGLVESRKKGRWVYYRLNNDPGRSFLAEQALNWVCEATSNDPVILDDLKILNENVRLDPDALCKSKIGK
jgi:DNA-binding transcriptional ArsR family regulator